MTCPSLVLPVNQRALDIQYILQDYSTRAPWLHLHRIEQMFDDRGDQLQMQLKKKKRRRGGQKSYIIFLKLNLTPLMDMARMCGHHQISSH